MKEMETKYYRAYRLPLPSIQIGKSMNGLPWTEFFPCTAKNITQWNGGAKADDLVEPIPWQHQVWNHPPTAFSIANLTHTNRVIPVMLFIEHINKITQSHALQARQLIIKKVIK